MSISSGLSCGYLTANFYSEKESKTLDTDLFIFSNAQSEGTFFVKQQSDISKVGTYEIFYSVALENYPDSSIDIYETFF